MPKRNNKRNQRRNKGRNRNNNNKQHNALLRDMLPLSTFVKGWPPEHIYAQVSWTLGGTITTTTTLGEILIQANNANDPGGALSAFQPVWYDQLQAFYNRYVVWGAKLEVNCHNATNSVPYTIIVFPSRTATGATTIVDTGSQPFAKVRQGGGASGNDFVRIVHFMTTARMMGRPPGVTTAFSGTANSNPSMIWYFIIGSQATDATTSVTVHDEIRLTQYIELYDRNSADASTLNLIKQKKKRSGRFNLDFTMASIDFSENKTPDFELLPSS